MKVKVGVLIILLLILFFAVGELGSESTGEEISNSGGNGVEVENTTTPPKPVVTKSGYSIGETVHFQNGQAITITESGYVYSDWRDSTIMYIDFTVENEGTEASKVSCGSFSVYANNNAVEQVTESDSFSIISLDPGRVVQGRIYVDVNPEWVRDIEVQVGDAVWVIQGFGSAVEIMVNGVRVEIPEELYYSSSWLDNAGSFVNTSSTSTVEIQFFDEPDDSVLGKMKISDSNNTLNYEGEFVLLLENVYYLVHDGTEQVLVSFYEHNMNGTYYTECLLFVDGKLIDFYYRPEV